MILIDESSPFKHSYPKQTLWIYYISSNPFLLFPLMSVSVEIFLFLCYQDDLEYHCILMPHEVFVGYDQTIANGIGQVSLELVQLKFVPYIIISYLISHCVTAYPTQHPQFCYTHFLNALSFCNLAFCATQSSRD
jgi:hypothetical protein